MLINVSFENNYALEVGADICDISNAGEVYSVDNVVDCTSFFAYSTSQSVLPSCKFYLLSPKFILDCLLPHPSLVGTACGYGSILVDPDPSSGSKDHKVCGSDKQPCQTLSYAIGVAGEGGSVSLVVTQDYPISNIVIENKSFKITEFAPSVAARIVGSFEKSGKALFGIYNASLEIIDLVLVYGYPGYDTYAETFFQTNDDGSELILTDCILTSNVTVDADIFLNETFIENLAGRVTLDNVQVNIARVDLKPLFSYVASSVYSSFAITNTEIKNIALRHPLLTVTNKIVGGEGSLYVRNSRFWSITQIGNDALEGLVISVDPRDVSDTSAATGYLEVIDLEDNVFYSIIGNSVTNGGSIALNMRPNDSSSYNYRIYNNTFISSSALERGGAIFILAVEIKFSFCSFIDCTSGDPNSAVGQDVHSESSHVYDAEVDFVQCCYRRSSGDPQFELYFPGASTSKDTYFSICAIPQETSYVTVDTAAGPTQCTSSVTNQICPSLTSALGAGLLAERTAIIISSSTAEQSLPINDLTTRIMGQDSSLLKSELIYSSGTGSFISVVNGLLMIENLKLIHNNFTFFSISGSDGTIRVTNCEVGRSYNTPQGSFLVAGIAAVESRVYIRNTTFYNLSFTETSLFKIVNCHVLSLTNVNISKGKGVYTTSSAPFVIDANPTANVGVFTLELSGVQISDINITHGTKGLISVTTVNPYSNIAVSDSHFDAIKVSGNVTNGSIFYIVNSNRTIFTNTNFSSSGGARVGGAVFVSKASELKFINSNFVSINVARNSRGGAVYLEVDDIGSSESGDIEFNGCSFSKCAAPGGRGGAVYLKFLQVLDCDSGAATDYRSTSYRFIATVLTENVATNGTNLFVEAYKLEHLFIPSNFNLSEITTGVGLIEYVAVDNCDENSTLVSIVTAK
jgi:hypothetical protein